MISINSDCFEQLDSSPSLPNNIFYILVEELRGVFECQIGEDDEGVLRVDALKRWIAHRCVPNPTSFVPAITPKFGSNKIECSVRDTRVDVNTTLLFVLA